jgi:hypothetical protein
MKTWSKLWHRESPRFRSLPLQARMLASYVLKFVDETGALPMGHRDPVSAVALAIGADMGDRRWLRSAVHALLSHGYLKVTDGDLAVPNYPRYQDGRPNTNPTRDERETNAKPTRDEHETDARNDLSVRKHVLAQDVLLEIREEVRSEKVEVRERDAPTGPAAPSADIAPLALTAEPAEKPKRKRPELTGTALVLADAFRAEAKSREFVYPEIVPSSTLSQVAKWLEAQCQLARCDVRIGAQAVAKRFFATKYPAEVGWPWKLFLAQHATYWPANEVRIAQVDDVSAKRRDLERQRREARSDLTRYREITAELEALG